MIEFAVAIAMATAAPPQELLRDLDPFSVAVPILLERVGEASGRLLFQRIGTHEAGLWVTDGSVAGTELLFPRFGAAGSASIGRHCIFFSGFGCDGRTWLWRSDGTRPGTVAVAPFQGAGDPVAYRGGVCFAALDAAGLELWWSDGTAAGTRLVVDLRPGPSSSAPSDLVVVGDRVLFLASDAAGVRGLWQSDATAAGTRAVATTPVRALARLGQRLAYVTTVGADAIVRLYDPATGGVRELWRVAAGGETFRAFTASDAAAYFTVPSLYPTSVVRLDTEGNLSVVYQGMFDFSAGFRVAGDAVIFQGVDVGGARVMGTRGGTAAALFPASSDRLRRSGVSGKQIFVGTDEAPDGATYVTDGTIAGTHRLASPGSGIWLGELGGDPVLGLASEAINSLERVRVDPLGLERIRHWKPMGNAGTWPGATSVGTGAAMFVTRDLEGPALYWTDGTRQGTHVITREEPSELVMAAERGYFTVGARLYTTLGASGTTRLVRDFAPYGVRGLAVRGDELIAFFARPGADELLWVTRDGAVYQIPFTESWVTARAQPIVTPTATYAIVAPSSGGVSLQRWLPRTFRPEAVLTHPALAYVGRMGGRLVLVVGAEVVTYDEATGAIVRTGVIAPPTSLGVFALGERVVWVTETGAFATDGTLAGSGWIMQERLFEPAVVGDRLYGAAFDAAAGREPWVTDGTVAGTMRLADVEPGRCWSSPWDFAPAGSGRHVLFSAETAAHGRELWTSDGTPAGTRLVADLMPFGDSRPTEFLAIGPRIVFWAEHRDAGFEPWTMPTGLAGGYVVRPLGGDCHAGSLPLQVTGAPRLGDAGFGFRVRSPVPGAGLFVFGASIGATRMYGCIVRVADLMAAFPVVSNAANELVLAAPVPSDARLLGTSFSAQCVLNQGAVLVSEATYITVGR